MKAASFIVKNGRKELHRVLGHIANINDTTSNATVVEESRRLNVEPSAYLYNTIISRLAKARKADYAMLLFQAMKAAGLTPTEVTYGAIIAGCARIGDVHTAEVLLEETRHSPGYQVLIPPYNMMMQLYTHVRPNRESALYYYNLMEQMGVQPTFYTYKVHSLAFSNFSHAHTSTAPA
jgi:pentatricopeptide repeat protein